MDAFPPLESFVRDSTSSEHRSCTREKKKIPEEALASQQPPVGQGVAEDLDPSQSSTSGPLL